MQTTRRTKIGRPFRMTLREWVQAAAPAVADRLMRDARAINRLFHSTTTPRAARLLGQAKMSRMVAAARVRPEDFVKSVHNGYTFLRHVPSNIGLHAKLSAYPRFKVHAC